MSRNAYTKVEKATVKEFAGIKTAEEISIILGNNRTRSSVLNYASSKKICLRKIGENHTGAVLSNLQAQIVIALNECGFSDTEIREACFSHVSRGCIYGITSGSNR